MVLMMESGSKQNPGRRGRPFSTLTAGAVAAAAFR